MRGAGSSACLSPLSTHEESPRISQSLHFHHGPSQDLGPIPIVYLCTESSDYPDSSHADEENEDEDDAGENEVPAQPDRLAVLERQVIDLQKKVRRQGQKIAKLETAAKGSSRIIE